MTTVNSTFTQECETEQDLRPGEMSVNESFIENESPPSYITFRKGSSVIPAISDLQQEFKTRQSSLLNRLDSWFSKQETKFNTLPNDFDEIKTTLKFISDKYDDLDKRTHDVSKLVSRIEQQLKSTPVFEARISELETKLAEFEQKTRNCNIEISNLPKKRSENLIQILENIAKVIKQPISTKDIVTIHRVPHMNPKISRPKNNLQSDESLSFIENTPEREIKNTQTLNNNPIEEPKTPRPRVPNFTSDEKALLAALIKSKPIVESKATDGKSVDKKENCMGVHNARV
ncbi:unnamed protein product [Parnassius apollo]|uniref:(apollo) hypothetical protein n=1 Tax=Parnassius apollo TaxID=110799 RepID=A0A8S3X4G1_PARAO|nr:unnamed protein product [Parnassius apollo]